MVAANNGFCAYVVAKGYQKDAGTFMLTHGEATVNRENQKMFRASVEEGVTKHFRSCKGGTKCVEVSLLCNNLPESLN